MDSKQQGQEGKKRPSLLKRIGKGISDFLCKKVIDEEITINVKADWLPGRKPETVPQQEPTPMQDPVQPQLSAKVEETKAEVPAHIETPKPTIVQGELDFDKPAEPIEQPVEKPAEKPIEKPIVEEKKAEAPKAESQKPAQPKPQPAIKKRVTFKCDTHSSKIKTWIRQLSSKEESKGIQGKIVSVGPACVEHLMRYVDEGKAFVSSRQIAANMIVKIWEKYSKDKDHRDDIVLLYSDEVLPFSDKLDQNLKGYDDNEKRAFKHMESEVKTLKRTILEKDNNEKNPETSRSGKDI